VGAAGSRRGRPPKLDLAQIIEAAEAFDGEPVTITALAERLGVARNAISYYVKGRNDLEMLLAERRLAARLERLSVPAHDWRAAVLAVTRGLYQALIDSPYLARVVIDSPGAGVVRPAEELLQALLRAGFSERVAGGTLGLVADLAFAAARRHAITDDLASTADSLTRQPNVAAVQRVIEDAPAAFPAFRRVFATSLTWDRNLDDEIAFLIELLESTLPR
jgi:AcrR family transcriptional regulator